MYTLINGRLSCLKNLRPHEFPCWSMQISAHLVLTKVNLHGLFDKAVWPKMSCWLSCQQPWWSCLYTSFQNTTHAGLTRTKNLPLYEVSQKCVSKYNILFLLWDKDIKRQLRLFISQFRNFSWNYEFIFHNLWDTNLQLQGKNVRIFATTLFKFHSEKFQELQTCELKTYFNFFLFCGRNDPIIGVNEKLKVNEENEG